MERAYQIGFVNQIAPRGKHVELAQVMAAKIAANAPLVVQGLKKLAREVMPKGPLETVAEVRRIPNLFEILAVDYWRANHGYTVPPVVRDRAAAYMADEAGRRGDAASIVLLTDCRANVALDGRGGRAAAEQDAISAARVLAGCGHGILLIDTAPRPHPFAADLGAALGARRLALPHAAPGLVPGIVAGAAKAMRRPSPSAMAGR